MSQSSKICVVCKQPVTGGKFCQLKNDYYHGQCFKCQVCSGSMEQGFCEYKGKYYCRKCYDADIEKTFQKCHVCQKAIMPGSKLISAANQHFHETCFKCADCGSVMQDKRVFPIMGKIYCVECHWGRKIEAEGMQIEKDKQSKNPPAKGVQT